MYRLLIIILSCLFCRCYTRAGSVREARQVLAAADSVRVNEGRLYDDSLALAEAYATTGKWRYIYPNDYARACYYYGYLLRQHGNQVAAMQAFIAGTHAPYIQRVVPLPWFNDYHILGRIYTNMGTMCHLADDFELGYDMYEQSAIAFQMSYDTTAYYYALNAMALELAEQKLHDETLALLDICLLGIGMDNVEICTVLRMEKRTLYRRRQLIAMRTGMSSMNLETFSRSILQETATDIPVIRTSDAQ